MSAPPRVVWSRTIASIRTLRAPLAPHGRASNVVSCVGVAAPAVGRAIGPRRRIGSLMVRRPLRAGSALELRRDAASDPHAAAIPSTDPGRQEYVYL
jgi:hypothetical protein